MQMYSLLDLPSWALFTSGTAFAALLALWLRDVQKVAKACLWLFVYIPRRCVCHHHDARLHAGAPEAIISPFAWVFINGYHRPTCHRRACVRSWPQSHRSFSASSSASNGCAAPRDSRAE